MLTLIFYKSLVVATEYITCTFYRILQRRSRYGVVSEDYNYSTAFFVLLFYKYILII